MFGLYTYRYIYITNGSLNFHVDSRLGVTWLTVETSKNRASSFYLPYFSLDSGPTNRGKGVYCTLMFAKPDSFGKSKVLFMMPIRIEKILTKLKHIWCSKTHNTPKCTKIWNKQFGLKLISENNLDIKQYKTHWKKQKLNIWWKKVDTILEI